MKVSVPKKKKRRVHSWKPGTRDERVLAQAFSLIAERKEMFGDQWRKNCSIKIPSGFKD